MLDSRVVGGAAALVPDDPAAGAGMTGLASLVSPYVGLVRSVDERLIGTADARLPTYTAELATDERLLGAPLEHVGALCGMGPDPSAAVDAVLGEAAERYSLCYLPHERIVEATADELGPAAVAPERFALFSEAQHAQAGFPFVPFTSATRVCWVEGRHVSSGAFAWIPAELVFLADPVRDGEGRIGYATSSGAACAPTEPEAVLGGLLELCERDAFAITWAARLSLPLLDWSAHAGLAAFDRRYFAPSGLDYAAVDLSRFHALPSVLAVVRAPASAGAALGVGAGTAPTIERAWWKALSEAFGTRAAARSLLDQAPVFAPDGRNVRTFDDHIAFHAAEERGAISSFLDASNERVDVSTIPPLHGGVAEQICAVAARIEAAGATAYAIDVTAPDVRSLGLHVVKTVVPGLCMLDVPHPGRFLGGARLRTVPVELGYAARPLAESELNPYPHPFP
jgi:ribosomal protein S12 methylthiotransferase accessory factor